MAISLYTIGAHVEPTAEECGFLARLAAERGRVTLLVPTYAEGEAVRRRLADAGAGIAIDVLTPSAWIEGLWRLLGDGTQLVNARDRLLLVSRVLCELAGEDGEGLAPLRDNPGSVHMIAEMAGSCLPFAREGHAAARAFSPAERRALEVLAVYGEELGRAGMCEPASAAESLAVQFAHGVPACARAVVVRGVGECPEHLLHLLEALGRHGDVVFVLSARQRGLTRALRERFGCAATPRSLEEPPMPAPACVEVCGPTARFAAYGRMTEALRAACEPGEEVVVATADPLGLWHGIAPRLVAGGMSVACEGSIPFSQTRAGEMLFALIDFLDRLTRQEASSWWPAPELSDWLRSPFCGIGPSSGHSALSLDTWLRKTRSLTKEQLFAELESRQSREQNRERARAEKCGAQPRHVVFKSVMDAIGARRYGRAVQLMREAASSASPSSFGEEGAAAQQRELVALQKAFELLERAHALGVSCERALVALEGLSVPCAWIARPHDKGELDGRGELRGTGDAAAHSCDVRIMRVDALAARAAASCGAVLIADASADAFPLASRETVSTVLAEKLGCPGLRSVPAERQRDAFVRALQAARRGTALAFVCRDNGSEELYPALAFAELREAYSAIEPAVSMPALPSEGSLVANLDAAGGAGMLVDDAPRAAEHALSPDVRPYVLLARRCINGRPVTRTLSASQVENYLACPYRWFVNSRVVTRRLDVEFGPIERGNFSHDVMQRFYERLAECGLMRVTPATLERCLAEMDRAFEEVRADHVRGKYTHGKYATDERPRAIRGALVALDELERMRIDAMLEQFHEVVRHEADVLPIYEPALLEYSFDREGVTYAGRPLGGRIDRVDTAPDAGDGVRFVVIDYKTGANVADMACPDPTMRMDEGEDVPEDWLPGRDRDRAPKVQALMYATALERSMGASARGAVYYGLRGPSIAGAVASALTECEPSAFPNDKVSPFPGVKGRLRVKRDGTMEFPELLARVETAIAGELDRLEAGDIAPRPASDSCMFCPLTTCEKRR